MWRNKDPKIRNKKNLLVFQASIYQRYMLNHHHADQEKIADLERQVWQKHSSSTCCLGSDFVNPRVLQRYYSIHPQIKDNVFYSLYPPQGFTRSLTWFWRPSSNFLVRKMCNRYLLGFTGFAATFATTFLPRSRSLHKTLRMQSGTLHI